MTNYEPRKLYEVNPNDLLSDPNQPRKVMDAQGLDKTMTKIRVIDPYVYFGLHYVR